MVSQLIHDFLNNIKHQKRLSPHTLTAYQNDLAQFNTFLSKDFDITDINEVSHHIIRTWIVELLENKVSPRTVNRKISCLKSFFKHLKKEGTITSNPMPLVITPKTSKRLPEFVEQSKMEMLFTSVNFETNFKGIRDKMLIELFYATGMRLSELVNLRIEDFNLSKSHVKVLGKRNKERLIPFSPFISKQIISYLEERQKITGIQTDAFFLTEKGRKIYQKLAYRIVKYYLSQVTTINKKSPHVLRHTFATHMLNNGAELNAIKEILGHANLAATQVYTHNSVEKLKKIHKIAHPKA